jgi:hypothetical protein
LRLQSDYWAVLFGVWGSAMWTAQTTLVELYSEGKGEYDAISILTKLKRFVYFAISLCEFSALFPVSAVSDRDPFTAS